MATKKGKRRPKEKVAKVITYCPTCGEPLPYEDGSCLCCGHLGDDFDGNEEAIYDGR